MSTVAVAVVGAGGNIGRALLARLVSDPSIRVRAICRNELTAAPLRLAGFDVRCGAVSDPPSAQTLVGDCDVVVNCAAAAALPGTARREERAIASGLLGVRGPRKLVHFSSVAVYGTCITSKNTYEHPRPDYPFGRDKLNLEHFVRKKGASSSVREIAILRMGHVYGAEQWVSRFVFDQLGTGWRLPFDGRLPSNAVHVKNVASAVGMLVVGGQVGTFNLFDWPQSTWRQVFDWNTNAIGESPIPGLEDAASEQLREHFARISRLPNLELLREVAAWGKSLPLSLAGSSLQVRFRVMSLMAALQSPQFEARVVKRFFGGHLARRNVPRLVEQSWVFCQEAPGGAFECPGEITSDDARAVARWYEGYSTPDALVPSAARGRERTDVRVAGT